MFNIHSVFTEQIRVAAARNYLESDWPLTEADELIG